jgi:hypothetical protein
MKEKIASRLADRRKKTENEEDPGQHRKHEGPGEVNYRPGAIHGFCPKGDAGMLEQEPGQPGKDQSKNDAKPGTQKEEG